MNHHFLIACATGVLLDLVFGDPRRMPHITRFIGWLSLVAEKWTVAVFGRSIVAGLFLWLFVAGVTLGMYLTASHYLMIVNPWLKTALDALLIFQVIAFKDLVKHVNDVKTGLGKNIETARQKISWIVGRDTDQMDESDVCRAAIESGSENLNDAVIGPFFWLFLTGPIGALIFRIANTLDAMVGHRTERFEKVGKISARIDDVLNFIPARLCAVLILPLGKLFHIFSYRTDAAKHPSINAGWPEVAMSKCLGVAIGGRMYEKGKLVQTEQMNEGAPQPTPEDIGRCTRAMGTTYAKTLLIGFGLNALLTIITYMYLTDSSTVIRH